MKGKFRAAYTTSKFSISYGEVEKENDIPNVPSGCCQPSPE